MRTVRSSVGDSPSSDVVRTTTARTGPTKTRCAASVRPVTSNQPLQPTSRTTASASTCVARDAWVAPQPASSATTALAIATPLRIGVLPPAQRDAAFAALRRNRPFAFFDEPDVPFLEKGPGYYALVRHADVEAVSSQPKLFCSGEGATSIANLPAELLEFYGSMISMDDPRHAKIRRIVSKAFTPKMLEALVDDVETITDKLLADARAVAESGDGTFDLVKHVSSPLPLKVICQMMGIPEEHEQLVLDQTNLILSGGDEEFIDDENKALELILGAGQALAGVMERLAEERRTTPTADLTSALIRTEVD